MSFSLKNAKATYQRLVNKVFKPLIRKNMEVYVDDMIVKSKDDTRLLAGLRDTFAILQNYGMKLNPKMCVFGVKSWRFLVFMINNHGIEANPDKLHVVLDLKPPQTVKEA